MPSYTTIHDLAASVVPRVEADRQSLMRRELETWLVEQCRAALQSGGQWNLDFSSLEAYEESCRPHREQWSRTVGEFQFDAPLNPMYEPFFEDEDFLARWVYIDLAEGLRGRAVLAWPKKTDRPMPMVIAQHGISSSPERVFGKNDAEGLYHNFGMRLLEAGFAVLAPSNITEAHPRARLHRLCLLLGKTLAGLEIGKIRRFIDFAQDLPEIVADRIAMWGISLGGHYTMFTSALETRIKVAINCAFFNSRFHKMAVSSPLYSCFLDVAEEHIWIPGWFAGGFGDAELAGLTCPRAMQIQQGRADGIGWWPLQHEEFKRARTYYEKLGMEDRIEYADHNGGHEILVDDGIKFLKKHL